MNAREGDRMPQHPEKERQDPYKAGMEKIRTQGQIDSDEMLELVMLGGIPYADKTMRTALLMSLFWEGSRKDRAFKEGVGRSDREYNREIISAQLFRDKLEEALPDPIEITAVREGLTLLREIRDRLPKRPNDPTGGEET